MDITLHSFTSLALSSGIDAEVVDHVYYLEVGTDGGPVLRVATGEDELEACLQSKSGEIRQARNTFVDLLVETFGYEIGGALEGRLESQTALFGREVVQAVERGNLCQTQLRDFNARLQSVLLGREQIVVLENWMPPDQISGVQSLLKETVASFEALDQFGQKLAQIRLGWHLRMMALFGVQSLDLKTSCTLAQSVYSAVRDMKSEARIHALKVIVRLYLKTNYLLKTLAAGHNALAILEGMASLMEDPLVENQDRRRAFLDYWGMGGGPLTCCVLDALYSEGSAEHFSVLLHDLQDEQHMLWQDMDLLNAFARKGGEKLPEDYRGRLEIMRSILSSVPDMLVRVSSLQGRGVQNAIYLQGLLARKRPSAANLNVQVPLPHARIRPTRIEYLHELLMEPDRQYETALRLTKVKKELEFLTDLLVSGETQELITNYHQQQQLLQTFAEAWSLAVSTGDPSLRDWAQTQHQRAMEIAQSLEGGETFVQGMKLLASDHLAILPDHTRVECFLGRGDDLAVFALTHKLGGQVDLRAFNHLWTRDGEVVRDCAKAERRINLLERSWSIDFATELLEALDFGLTTTGEALQLRLDLDAMQRHASAAACRILRAEETEGLASHLLEARLPVTLIDAEGSRSGNSGQQTWGENVVLLHLPLTLDVQKAKLEGLAEGQGRLQLVLTIVDRI